MGQQKDWCSRRSTQVNTGYYLGQSSYLGRNITKYSTFAREVFRDRLTGFFRRDDLQIKLKCSWVIWRMANSHKIAWGKPIRQYECHKWNLRLWLISNPFTLKSKWCCVNVWPYVTIKKIGLQLYCENKQPRLKAQNGHYSYFYLKVMFVGWNVRTVNKSPFVPRMNTICGP